MSIILDKINGQIFKHASAAKKADLLRKKAFHVGKNVLLFTYDIGTEPYLISIHDNVIVAAGVKFINHDLSCWNIARYTHSSNYIDKVGKIELFDNCFIGAWSILMPNTSVGRNSIVGAGSIVTSNIPDNEVWAGVPAKKIMTVNEYAEKMISKSSAYPWIEDIDKLSGRDLIDCRQKFFFHTFKN